MENGLKFFPTGKTGNWNILYNTGKTQGICIQGNHMRIVHVHDTLFCKIDRYYKYNEGKNITKINTLFLLSL